MPNKEWKKKTSIFLTSQAITLFGSSLVQFALVWYVTLKTGSGFWVSMLTICAYVPQFLVSFFAGVWADRYSRKKLIIYADASIAVTTLILVILLSYINKSTMLLSAILITSVIRSIGAGIQTPSVGAIIPQLVPKEKLMRVNGINATIQSIVQFAAPAAAGAILSLSTLKTTLFIDIVTAIIGIGLFSCIFVPKQERIENEKQTSIFEDLITGVKYAFADKFLSNLLLLFGLYIFLCVPAGFLATLFVSRTYGNSYIYLTIVELVGFAGMTAGGILIGFWGGFNNRVLTLFVGIISFGILGIGMGAVNNFIVYLILMFVYGIAITMVQTSTTTLIQENTKPEMQGRIFGFLGAMFSGFLPLGMVVFGPLSDIIQMKWLMIGSGIIIILISLLMVMSKEFYKAGIKK